MSALWASPCGEPPSPPSRTRLQAVPRAPARLDRVPFVGILIVVFGLGMAGLLMVNTTLQGQVFEARALNRQASELDYLQADLEGKLDRLGTAPELARRASALGLRPNPRPAFLQVPSGKVIGKARPVTGAEVPGLVVKTPAQLAAERAEAEAKAKAAALRRAAEQRAKALAAKRKAADQAEAARRQAEERQARAQQPAGPEQPRRN